MAAAPAAAPDSKQCWSSMEACKIPTKAHLHPSFKAALLALHAQEGSSKLLDLGCGDGRIALQIEAEAMEAGKPGLEILGVDVNAEAIETANRAAERAGRRARFVAGDVGAVDLSAHGPFDLVLCQLVISVVGAVDQRRALLDTAKRRLKPGGVLLLSASGASESVNESYQKLYEKDFETTKEWRTYLRTYLSRGAEEEILYITHHFEKQELELLVSEAGFQGISTVEESEASSRRPEEKAIFLYTTASVPQ